MAEVSRLIFRYKADGAQQAQRADEKVRDSVKKTSREAQRSSGTVERWMTAHKTAIIAIGAATAGIIGTFLGQSTVMQASLGGIRLAFSLLADSIFIHLEPAFLALEEAILDANDAFNELPEGQQKAIAFTLAFAAGLGVLLVAVGALAGPVGTAIGVIGQLIGWLAGASAGALAFAGAFGAALGLFLVWVLEVTGGLEKVSEFARSVGDKLGGFADEFQAVLTAMFLPLIALGALVVGIVRGDIGGAFEEVGDLLENWWANVKELWENVAGFFVSVWAPVKDFFVGLWDDVSQGFLDLVDAAFTWGRDMLFEFGRGIESAADFVADKASSAWDTTKDFFSFDEAQNDAMAMRWGRDFSMHFGSGIERGMQAFMGANFGGGPAQAAPTASAPVTNVGGNRTQTFVFEKGALVMQGTGNAALDEDRLVSKIVRIVGQATRNRTIR